MKIKNKGNTKKLFFLSLIFILALFLRLLLLGEIPAGITDDEANVGYDTLLLTQSGQDQWGKSWPLEFKGFGDYRLAVYQYLLFPLVKAFGLSNFIIRLPNALIGSTTVLVVYFFILQLFKGFKNKHHLALIAAFVLALNPWHFGMSRWIMEANVGLFFTLLALALLLRNKNKDWLYGAIFIALSFYTYYSLRVFLPLILVFLIFFYQQWPRKKIASFVSLVLFLCLPIFLSLFKSAGGVARIKQVNLTNDAALINQIGDYRKQCLNSNLFSEERLSLVFKNVCFLFFNRPVFWLRQLVLNYFNHFSFSFLFFEEFERAWQFLPPTAFFYFFNLPFFLLGLFKSLIKFKKESRFLLFWALLAPLVDSLTSGGHYARSLMLLAPIVIWISLGYYCFFSLVRQKKKKIYYFLITPVLVFNSFFIALFLVKYFFYFPQKQSKYSHYAYQPLFVYLKKVEDEYDAIYISRKQMDQRQYIFYLYYNQIPAKQYFQLDTVWEEEPNGWIMVKKLGKYHFIDEVNQIDDYLKNSLLAISPIEFNQGGNIGVISFLDGEEAFRIYETDKIFNHEKQ